MSASRSSHMAAADATTSSGGPVRSSGRDRVISLGLSGADWSKHSHADGLSLHQFSPLISIILPNPMHDVDDSDFLAHFESPYPRGRLAAPSATQHLRNPTCGDWVVLDVRWSPGGRIEALHFEGQGCIVSQAAASILCERAEGRTFRELAALEPRDMLGWIGIPLMLRRQQCALLVFRALKMIIYQQQGSGCE